MGVPVRLTYFALVPMTTMKMMAISFVDKFYMIVMFNLLVSTVFTTEVVVPTVFRMMSAVVNAGNGSSACSIHKCSAT